MCPSRARSLVPPTLRRHGPSRSSSQRGSSSTAEAAALGLQRSISHRQMSLGSKPSAESLQAAGGGSTHELPRLPGAMKLQPDIPAAASTAQL